MSDNFLTHIDTAKREILAADSLVKVKDLWNRADAVRALGQAAKDPELVNYATEFKLRCERRLGEMLASVDLHKGGRPTKTNDSHVNGFKLSELEIDPRLSSRAQRIASVPEDKFEAVIAEAKEGERQITRGAIDSLLNGHNYRAAQGGGPIEWYTPREYLDLVRQVLGEIDLDPASSEHAQKSVQAREFFTIADDGLSRPWYGRVWLNPPYSQPHIFNFVQKLISELDNVESAILLTHNYTDTEWFHLAQKHAPKICFTKGRIGFVDSSGEVAAPCQGQAFFYYGNDAELFSRVFSEIGFVVRREEIARQ